MNFICQRDELLSALQAAGRAIAQRSPMQVLENVYIEAGPDGLSVMGTDLNLGIITNIHASIEEEGSVLLPGRLLTEIIRKLPEGEVSVQVNERFTAVIRANGSRTTLQGLAKDEYPQFPEVVANEPVSIAKPLLKEMIRQTGFAIAQDESRPILTGCLLELDGANATMVALDGFRLAIRQGTLENEVSKKSCVIPGKYLQEIGRLLGDGDDAIDLLISESHLLVSLEHTSIAVRLLEGEYVKYRQLLPGQYQTTMRVGRELLSDCVDRASLMAREGRNNLLKFSVTSQELTIASNSELGDVFEQLPVHTTGQDLTISFNVRYINEAIKSLDDEEVYFRFNSPITPCVIMPVDGEDFLFLVLPVRTYQ